MCTYQNAIRKKCGRWRTGNLLASRNAKNTKYGTARSQSHKHLATEIFEKLSYSHNDNICTFKQLLTNAIQMSYSKHCKDVQQDSSTYWSLLEMQETGFPLFYWQIIHNFQDFPRPLQYIFQDLFVAPENLNITYWHHKFRSRRLQVICERNGQKKWFPFKPIKMHDV